MVYRRRWCWDRPSSWRWTASRAVAPRRTATMTAVWLAATTSDSASSCMPWGPLDGRGRRRPRLPAARVDRSVPRPAPQSAAPPRTGHPAAAAGDRARTLVARRRATHDGAARRLAGGGAPVRRGCPVGWCGALAVVEAAARPDRRRAAAMGVAAMSRDKCPWSRGWRRCCVDPVGTHPGGVAGATVPVGVAADPGDGVIVIPAWWTWTAGANAVMRGAEAVPHEPEPRPRR